MRVVAAVVSVMALAANIILSAIQWASNQPGGDGEIARWTAQLGLSAVFLWQWQRSEKRADSMHAEMIKILERDGPILQQTVDALRDVRVALQAATPRPTDIAALTDDIHRLARDIHDVVGRQDT